MKKTECMQAMGHLADLWQKQRGFESKKDNELPFNDFYDWVENNYPTYLNFRSSNGVRFDVEIWFNKNFKQTYAR